MPFELFIALRYLRARRQQTAVSVITAIAVAGITIGVAALIVAQAMIHGFRTDVQDKILAGTDHLNLLKEDNSGIENYKELTGKARQIPGVVEASATIYAPVLLSVGGRQEQAILKGLETVVGQIPAELASLSSIEGDPTQLQAQAAQTEDLPEELKDEQTESESPTGIFIGQQLAKALGVKLEDRVTAISVVNRLTPTGMQPRPRYTQFRVVGIFSSGWYQYDSKWAYVTLSAAQQMTGNGDTAGVIRLKVEDIYQVTETGKKLRAIAGQGFITTDWQELNRPLFAALQLQHKVIITFFALLIAIAALNIVTTFTMMVIEKQRDIAVLRAQGATPQNIRLVFLLQGLIIGIIGSGLGLLLGVLTCAIANHYRLISIPPEIYSISHVTLRLQTFDCLWITGLAIAISLLATTYPANSAAKLAPAQVLRHD